MLIESQGFYHWVAQGLVFEINCHILSFREAPTKASNETEVD